MKQILTRKNSVIIPGVLAICLGLGLMLNNADAADKKQIKWPAVSGAVFALRNTHLSTRNITLDKKGRDLMVFDCIPRGRALIGRNYELVCDGGSYFAQDAGAWIGSQVSKSGAFTLEAVLTPAKAQPKAPGVVLAYGNDKGENVALLQNKKGLSLRWGGARTINLFPLQGRKQVHVLVVCGNERWTAYRNGQAVSSGTRPAKVSAWEQRELVLGAAWSGAEPWRGKVEGVGVFARALTTVEAAAENAAIKQFLAKQKPATTIRFRGVLVRQAKTSDVKAIEPYTRSLTAAEYKIEKILSGKWKEPTITVLHWMIMDGKRLPIADRKPGAKVELSVDPLEQHPQLEEQRRDDELGDELVLDQFYCESEGN